MSQSKKKDKTEQSIAELAMLWEVLSKGITAYFNEHLNKEKLH